MSGINKDAEKIKEILIRTPTEDRGDLLLKVSQLLEKETQYFTGTAILKAAYSYGFNKYLKAELEREE